MNGQAIVKDKTADHPSKKMPSGDTEGSQEGEPMRRFRNSASFGKYIELWIIGRMLEQGLDIYLPLVDDMGIDAIVRKTNGHFVEVQIKATSKTVSKGEGAFFAGITHSRRKNYWFIFYSERMNKMWILSSAQFVKEAHVNRRGKDKGKWNIRFNTSRKNRYTGEVEEKVSPKFEKYLAEGFSRIFAP